MKGFTSRQKSKPMCNRAKQLLNHHLLPRLRLVSEHLTRIENNQIKATNKRAVWKKILVRLRETVRRNKELGRKIKWRTREMMMGKMALTHRDVGSQSICRTLCLLCPKLSFACGAFQDWINVSARTKYAFREDSRKSCISFPKRGSVISRRWNQNGTFFFFGCFVRLLYFDYILFRRSSFSLSLISFFFQQFYWDLLFVRLSDGAHYSPNSDGLRSSAM